MDDPPEGGPERGERASLDGSSGGVAESSDAKRFEVVVNDVPVPVVVFDGDGRIRGVNDAVTERLGYGRSDLVGEPLGTLCPSLSVAAVADHCGTENADPLTVRGRLADGADAQFDLTVERDAVPDGNRYVAVVHDVTERQTRLRNLEQYERIVETIDDGIYILDDAFNIISVNEAVSDLTGYDRSELVGSNAAILASEETLREAAAVSAALVSGDSDAATITTTLETADGECLPVETRFSVYPFGDGSYGQVGVLRDISDRIRYERGLSAIHESTRQLLGAETPEAVARLVAEAAENVPDLSAVAVYLFDEEASALRPAATWGIEDGPLSPVGPDSSDLWETFTTGERVRDDSGPPLVVDRGAELAASAGSYLPLGTHGVFVAAFAEAGEFSPSLTELVDILAASAEAGLDRVDREQRLRDRDRELREQNDRLRRLEAINEVIRGLDQALVGAESREAVAAAVCDRLADSELFSFVWAGHADGETVVPDAWAGDAPDHLDEIDRSLAGEGGPPAVRTLRTGEPTVVGSIAADLRAEPWRQAALAHGLQSAVSVPLTHGDITYGVLTAYTDRPDGIHEQMTDVFRELGATVANALSVVDTRQWLSADTVAEVDLAVDAGSSPLVAVAAATGATLVHEGTVPDVDGLSRVFLGVEGADLSAVRAAADEQTVVRRVEHRSESEADPLVVLHVSGPAVPRSVTDHGSRLRSMVVTGDGIEATVDLAPTASVRDLVEALEADYGPVSLGARRERTPTATSEGGFRVAARDRLTDRQWAVLRTAYLSGFFDSPRTTTGQEIAETFDLSQPTINRHLRVGERKLLELLFEE
jgi:PAS domain S-box-containing protein